MKTESEIREKIKIIEQDLEYEFMKGTGNHATTRSHELSSQIWILKWVLNEQWMPK